MRSRLNQIEPETLAPSDQYTDSSGVSTSFTSAPRSDAEQAETEGAIRRRNQDLALIRLSLERDPAPALVEPERPPIPRGKLKRELITEQRAEDRAFTSSLEGLSEQDYCRAKHDAGRPTPLSWQNWGCPADYLDAFDLKSVRLRARFIKVLRHSERKNARRRSHLPSEK
jgi:hypothetical protein